MNRNATFRQLRIFEAVARLLSFSRAAEELHLTQPAVSTQIRLLQESTGVELFEQLGKRIHLTPAGHEMLRHARIILSQMQQASAAMSNYHDMVGGILNVASISAADYFFPHLLATFYKRHPNIQLNLQVLNGEHILHGLHHNMCDVAVLSHPTADNALLLKAFAPHPYVLIAAPAHPLAHRTSLTLSDLSKESFVVRERGSDTYWAMKSLVLDPLGSPRVALQIASNEAIKQAVMAGLGLGFVSAYAVSLELQTKRLVALDVEGYPVLREWFVVKHKDKQLSRVAQAFLDFLVDEGATLLGQLTSVAWSTA